MKIDKSIFSLALMVKDEDNYNGTLGIRYNDRVLGKFTTIDNSLDIGEGDDDYNLTESERKIIKKVGEIIGESFGERGFKLNKWILQYSYQSMSTISIEYETNREVNYIKFNLIEDIPICNETLKLSRAITKRLLDKL